MKKALVPTLVAIGVLLLVGAGVAIYLAMTSGASTPANESAGESVASAVDSDSHYLDEVGPDAVTVVEFLDFECGACGQFYPYVEEIRTFYSGEINYVVRYFPLPNHPHSVEAAVAAEAAAQQGEFEGMYHSLFETQSQWAGADGSQAEFFRALAEDLGLDLDAYDAAVIDPATQARVAADFEAGGELGVNSTPSFFVNDERIDIQSIDDLPQAINDARKN